MSQTPTPIPDEAVEDLIDLQKAIDSLLLAIANGQEGIEERFQEAMHLIECCAVLHCGIVAKTLRDYRHSFKAMGMKQVTMPADWVGPWFVTPTSEAKS